MKSNSPYNVYKSHFINELYKRKGVVTNTDIDGILSASLLCKLFPHLSVLGFTNSCTNIYLTDNVKKNDVLYVDIFMCYKDVFSVDNHIIGSKHSIIENSYKINPNIFYNIYVETYTKKYPFSTFIFLLSLIDDKIIDIDIDEIIGKTSDDEDIFLWELLLRADDTLFSTYKYRENATNWWNILLNNSNNHLLRDLYKKVCEVNNITNAYALKKKVQKFLLETFETKTDGFKTIETPNFKKFFTYLTEIMKYKCVFPEITKNYVLQSEKKDVSSLEEIKKEYDVKTLAIINKNTVSFSYNSKNK